MTTSIHPSVQMGRNFDAVCRFRLLDSFGLRIVLAEQDRVFAVPRESDETELLRRFDQLELARDLVGAEALLHKPPAWILENVGADSARKIRSFRGDLPGGPHGDQWVVYRLSRGRLQLGLLVEMDVDEETPLDLVRDFRHLGTVLQHAFRHTKTDPFEVAKSLEKAGIVA